jgi:hypothetical protein
MSDGFEGYDGWKLRSPEDDYYRHRRPLCTSCGEACDGLLCEDCADEREREEER